MAETKSGFSGLQVLLFVALAVLVTAGATYWFVRTYVTPSEFRPISLSQREQLSLDGKLQNLGLDPRDLMPSADRGGAEPDRFDSEGRLEAERYSELDARREIDLSERELNALVASNPDLARRFAIDLSTNMASAKLLVPVDPDFPVMGGRTIRVSAGLEIAYRDARPVVILRGISVMGVPIPEAWLGNLKNVDLVDRFGGDPGFWRQFAAGVDAIEVSDGKLRVRLKE